MFTVEDKVSFITFFCVFLLFFLMTHLNLFYQINKPCVILEIVFLECEFVFPTHYLMMNNQFFWL